MIWPKKISQILNHKLLEIYKIYFPISNSKFFVKMKGFSFVEKIHLGMNLCFF